MLISFMCCWILNLIDLGIAYYKCRWMHHVNDALRQCWTCWLQQKSFHTKREWHGNRYRGNAAVTAVIPDVTSDYTTKSHSLITSQPTATVSIYVDTSTSTSRTVYTGYAIVKTAWSCIHLSSLPWLQKPGLKPGFKPKLISALVWNRI